MAYYIKINPNILLGKTNKKPKTIICRVNKNQCWNVISHKARGAIDGYPQIGKRIGGKRYMFSLSRLMYKHFVGTMNDNLLVCHTCDNPKCINPTHLWLGNNQDNLRDACKKGRMPKGERNCTAKLNRKQVMEIREICHKFPRLNKKVFADKYGVALATFYQANSGHSWGWLKDDEE